MGNQRIRAHAALKLLGKERIESTQALGVIRRNAARQFKLLDQFADDMFGIRGAAAIAAYEYSIACIMSGADSGGGLENWRAQVLERWMAR